MSLLAALTRAYDRLPDAPPYGYSCEKIAFCVVLNPDGTVADVKDLRDSDKKRSPRVMFVPQPPKKAAGIKPNFLWEKTSYALGVTAKDDKRTADEHLAFKEFHQKWLEGCREPSLQRILRFIENWTPQQFVQPLWPLELLDENLVFACAENYRDAFVHQSTEASEILQRIRLEDTSPAKDCLITGIRSPIARLHPSIKGVRDAQSSGASIVSFNNDAYESYGHNQGDNAPVGYNAAFAYTAALNYFLAYDSRHRIQIGDASTVFWADCADAETAAQAESYFADLVDPKIAEKDSAANATGEIHARLNDIRAGKRLADVAPNLATGVRFHVLGLAPNAARLSVRFYWDSDFGTLTAHYQNFLADTEISPPPRDGWPPLWRYLVELAVLGKRENVPPKLAGEWMRSILQGTHYPMTLLSTALMRMRSNDDSKRSKYDLDPLALRVAIVKSVLIRNLKQEAPVALDPTNTNRGYVLGRLFAVYEEVQRAALGGNVNATIKDKFYGAASATPQKVFAAIGAGAQNHFSKLRKLNAGRAVNLEKLIMGIVEAMAPADDPIPVSLSPAEQALFAIGYYHQRSDFFRKADTSDPNLTEPAE